MRISTQGAYQRGVSLMLQLQAALDRTQQQISSGRRLLTPSDDPIAAGRALNMKEGIARLDQFERNGNMARTRLSFEESTLASANDVMQRVRELAIQANNATQSNESRGLIALELRQQLDALLEFGNQKDGNGRYLFSGNMEDTEPFARNGASFSYNGDQGSRMIQIGDSRHVPDGDPGSAVFFRVRNGNGVFNATPAAANTGSGILAAGSVTDPTLYDQDQYTIRFVDAANYEVFDSSAAIVATGSFQSGAVVAFAGIEIGIDGEPAAGDEFDVAPSSFTNAFAIIDELANAVESSVNGSVSRSEMTNGINAGILALDQAIGSMLETRTRVGSRLAAVENQEAANSNTVLTLQQTVADLEDLDYAEALSRLSIETTTLQAAQQSFIRTQNLSLFNYL